MVPAPVPGFDLLQFGALFLSEIGRHFPMRFRESFADASPGGSSNLFQLGGCFIHDRRYFGDLFRRQVQLRPKAVAHPFAHHSPVGLGGEKMARVRRPKESAGHSAGDKDKDETDDYFPFQRAIHCGNSS
jgi:hypothetical protein